LNVAVQNSITKAKPSAACRSIYTISISAITQHE